MSANVRTLGSVARELCEAAWVARRAIGSARLGFSFSDDAASELAQATVLLMRAAARFDQHCGLPDIPVPTSTGDANESKGNAPKEKP